MAIFGHHRGNDDEKESVDPLTLSEVTFQLSPANLRRVADFLQARAAEIDAGTFVDGGRHLRDYDRIGRRGLRETSSWFRSRLNPIRNELERTSVSWIVLNTAAG